jgi:hypothetical protein
VLRLKTLKFSPSERISWRSSAILIGIPANMKRPISEEDLGIVLESLSFIQCDFVYVQLFVVRVYV